VRAFRDTSARFVQAAQRVNFVKFIHDLALMRTCIAIDLHDARSLAWRED
jgi:hypothetical protein